MLRHELMEMCCDPTEYGIRGIYNMSNGSHGVRALHNHLPEVDPREKRVEPEQLDGIKVRQLPLSYWESISFEQGTAQKWLKELASYHIRRQVHELDLCRQRRK